MADVDLSDVIEFIQHLKRGFDKDLFESKIAELAYVAESTGVESDDFHTLFKLWLNLSIPIAKWVSLGACLIPQEQVKERTVDYAFRWLLANCDVQENFSRMAFLLDWLTAAMDSESIDMKALDSGYEIFFSLLQFESLTAHVLKIVYNLTKPLDVTRPKVLELLDYAKKREGKKNQYRQFQVLLSLFKLYRPECVPEDIPAIAIHSSFRKIHVKLVERFKRSQERRNISTKGGLHLMWTNPINSEGGRNKKADPLIPNMEFTNLGSQQYSENAAQKTHLDFSEPVSLLHQSLQRGLARPSRLRALLCNDTGLVLLATATGSEQQAFSHDLHHILCNCFLQWSPHSYAEKEHFLQRLASLQRTLLQGIPVVTRFLAQFLPFWNEREYFAEILSLVEWVSAESTDELRYIVEPLQKAYYRAEPLQQCAILRALTNMYCNLVFSSTRTRQHFSSARTHNYPQILPYVAGSIADMGNKGLQVDPDDMRVLYSTLQALERCSLSEAGHGASLGTTPRALTLALPLLMPSAAAIEKMAALLLLYRKIFTQMKAANKHKDPSFIEQQKYIDSYPKVFLSFLYEEQALSCSQSSIFDKLNPRVVAKLHDLIPDVDAKFSLKNSLAFAPKVLSLTARHDPTVQHCFDLVRDMYPNLCKFLLKLVPDLRY